MRGKVDNNLKENLRNASGRNQLPPSLPPTMARAAASCSRSPAVVPPTTVSGDLGNRRSYRDVLMGLNPVSTSLSDVTNCTPVVERSTEMEEGEIELDYSGDTDVEEEPRRKVLRVELEKMATGPGRTNWMTEGTRTALTRAIVGPNRDQCRYCNFRGTTKRVRYHIEQHFLRHFCKCGMGKISRDTMLEHVKKNRGNPDHGVLHKVDRATYEEFTQSMGWDDPPYFAECRPTLGQDLRERIVVKGLRLEPPAKRHASVRESRRETEDEERPRHSDHHRSHGSTKPKSTEAPSRSKKSDSGSQSKSRVCSTVKSKSKSAPATVVGPKYVEPTEPSESTVNLPKSPSAGGELKSTGVVVKPKTRVSQESGQEECTPHVPQFQLVVSEPASTSQENSQESGDQHPEDDIGPSQTERPFPAPSAPVPPLRSQLRWRVDLLTTAATLRQQASQHHLMGRTLEEQARKLEEMASKDHGEEEGRVPGNR